MDSGVRNQTAAPIYFILNPARGTLLHQPPTDLSRVV
jgi:hypothetical protein